MGIRILNDKKEFNLDLFKKQCPQVVILKDYNLFDEEIRSDLYEVGLVSAKEIIVATLYGKERETRTIQVEDINNKWCEVIVIGWAKGRPLTRKELNKI